ncbi:MAG: hypothetical protein RLZZ338_3824 [Cyanobacteriota bacterium]
MLLLWYFPMKMSRLRQVWLKIGLCLLILIVAYEPSAIASIHKYPESGNQVMYRAVQSLRDAQEKAWQIVLYKRVKFGLIQDLHLRIVGFPGNILPHPIPLELYREKLKIGVAEDITSPLNLPENVGEYDFRELLPQIESNSPLRILLPRPKYPIEILLPPFVVKEWRLLLEDNS